MATDVPALSAAIALMNSPVPAIFAPLRATRMSPALKPASAAVGETDVTAVIMSQLNTTKSSHRVWWSVCRQEQSHLD
jgi:hypothetical protein